LALHCLAGFFGLSECFEGRAADLDGALVLIDRPPRRYEAGVSVKAGAAAALITDHERKAGAARVPYFHVLDGTNDTAELHGHFHRRLFPRVAECEAAVPYRPIMVVHARSVFTSEPNRNQRPLLSLMSAARVNGFAGTTSESRPDGPGNRRKSADRA
jgi:hypothetical protein